LEEFDEVRRAPEIIDDELNSVKAGEALERRVKPR
jgi:hypothetical protein